jgi:hypothetical protein
MNEADPKQESVPAHTTPTWEMELLISGATIVGLLQLPGLLDRAYFRVVNLAPGASAQLMQPLWLYTKMAVVTLLITFLAHLCMRGYWVALVGMNSVFPGGIHWDRLGLGRIARDVFSGRSGQMSEMIERADNRATLVFGVGFSFAMLMLALTLLALLAIAASLATADWAGGAQGINLLFLMIGLVFGPLFLANQADRRLEGFLGRHPAAARAVGAITLFYGRIGFGPGSNPLVSLFASRVGRRRFAAIAMLVILSVGAGITLQMRGGLPFGLSHGGLPGADPFSGSSAPNDFYADTRGDGYGVMPLPHIRSRIVDGPYLELFVPYVARLHGPALDRDCAQHGVRARLDCMARMVAIAVDGQATPVRLEASTDPSTGQPGMLAMLPVSALAPGRHELSLNEPDRRKLDGAKPRRYRIPFWK